MENKSHILQNINRLAISDPMGFVTAVEHGFDKTVLRLAERIQGTAGCKIVMLAGPSASGKTTTADFLKEKLATLGIKAHSISIDNFYKDQRQSPENQNGTPDYETVHALDLPLWKYCMDALLTRGESEIPVFDFSNGRRSSENIPIGLDEDDLVIIEGIHALNPLINEAVPHEQSLRIYISVSSRIYSEDGQVFLTKRNLRLVRRLVRDFHFRSSSVENTFRLWDSVLRGEDGYLFPYKTNADMFVDSTHGFEPCVFRELALPLLRQVPENCSFCKKAEELIRLLEGFEPIPVDLIPKKSLLREFIGER